MPSVAFRCEEQFWNSSVLAQSIDEPLGTASGLFLILFAVMGDAGLQDPPLQFCIARASLIFCGLGTCAYHILGESAMNASHTNRNLYDGVSMAVVTTNLFLLHLNQWLQRHLLFSSCLIMLYLFFWVATNDEDLYNYLTETLVSNGFFYFSIGIQYPIFVLVYIYITVRICLVYGSDTFTKLHYPMWIALITALVFWVAYEFGCSEPSRIFFGHAIWHIGIGYVAIYLTILGAEMTYGLKKDPDSSVWWPKYRTTMTSFSKAELTLPASMKPNSAVILRACFHSKNLCE